MLFSGCCDRGSVGQGPCVLTRPCARISLGCAPAGGQRWGRLQETRLVQVLGRKGHMLEAPCLGTILRTTKSRPLWRSGDT